MGKKARKTRWRTLSIGEGPSDTESQSGDGAKPQGPRGRWGQGGGGPGAHQRYNSSHSTPTRQYHHRQYHTHNGADSGARWGPAGGRALHASASTRSSSTASENKITFNEDEYTKITTPRQDVLFKKGYLSKPKPHLQRPLTSAGNSTGDGTPDHQSADGADYPENDFDIFPYPSYDPSLYYLNTFDNVASSTPHPTQPVLLYDQFGNAALCYPPPAAMHSHVYQPPHHTTSTSTTSASSGSREKRYSVDSMTESTSPHNESNETFPEPEEVFEGVKAFPAENLDSSNQEEPTSDPEEVENENEEENEEKKLRKKRRRRKSEISVEEIEENTSENVSEVSEHPSEELKSKYRVDAEEFIPRGFAPGLPLGFVPLVPHEVFPGAFVFMGPHIPPPHFYPAVPTIPEPPTAEPPCVEEPEAAPTQASGPIDIAKIVSKLEQAAREQKQQETEGAREAEADKPEVVDEKDDRKAVEKQARIPEIEEKIETIKNDNTVTNKTEQPVAVRYADRLKQQQAPARKNNTPVTATPLPKHSQRAPPKRVVPNGVCPRLERSATVKPTPVSPSPVPPSSDQWISVSGKKKRKSTQKQTSPDVTLPVETTPPETPPPAPVLPTPVPEVEAPISAPPPPTTSPSDKTPKNKVSVKTTSAKKQVKKRIIITDGALQGAPPPPPEPLVCSPAPAVVDEQAANSNLGENKIEVPKTPESKEPEVPVVPPAPEPHLTPDIITPEVPKQPQSTTEHKKAKKKKNKPKLSTSTDISTGTESLSAATTPDVTGAQQDDDMSLELDRMIQRGLYANLEQKLQNFNPGDSFLATLGRSAPSGGSLIYPKPSLLSFPPLILPQAASPTLETTKSSPSPQASSPPTAGGPQGLSITQAVREWMDRTREATPEVEIFRRPQELRQDVLLAAIEDIEVSEDDDDGSSSVEESEAVEGGVQVPVDRTALDASLMVDEDTRSRSASMDLLQCWDYEQPQPQPDPLGPVDPAEDALESYESVYGRSGDFQRIQSEVGLRPRPRARGDGGLPYRAICCTVM